MRGSVTGFKAGDKVKVWFDGGRQDARTRSPSPRRPAARGNRVLILARRGLHRRSRRTRRPLAGPKYLAYYTDALADAGIPADVYDIDAQGRTRADPLGVLGHYKAVVWYTGDDIVTAIRARRAGSLEAVRRPS